MIIFLFRKSKLKEKKYTVATVLFIAVLILMLVLLVTAGKSAFIENLPMWVAYALLFIINFMSFLDKKEVARNEEIKEKATSRV